MNDMKLLLLTIEIAMILVLRVSFGICGYDRQCPHSSQRRFRIRSECNGNSTIYNCLYNTKNKTYSEFCDKNEEARAGLKYVMSGTFRNVRCSDERYQPITFWSNHSTDCLYLKSQCTGIGQLVFDNTSTIGDSNCRCDFTRHFAFVSQPRNPCFCTPSIEDCSCYIKQCQYNTTLSPDYECVFFNSTYKKFKCKKVTHVHTPGSEVATFNKDDKQYIVLMRSVPTGLTVIILACCLVIAGFGILVIHIQICRTEKDKITLNENGDGDIQSTENDEQTRVIGYGIGGSIDNMASIIHRKCDEHKPNHDGKTPLMFACGNGNLPIVTQLINRGADINISDKNGQTPFYWSCVGDNITIVELLIGKGCDENEPNNNGKTPLMAACGNGNLSTVTLLINTGTTINITDKKGQTPFYWACVGCNLDIVKLLIDNGCDEHKPNNDGKTSLMAACANGSLSIATLLIKRGADINITDKKGRTSFDWSCIGGNCDILNLFTYK